MRFDKLTLLSILFLSALGLSSDALAVPATQWIQSGANLVWVPSGGPDGGLSLALTVGGGTNYAPDFVEWDLRAPRVASYDWFSPPDLTDDVPLPLGAGQYFCYVVDGNLPVTSQFFYPSNHSFACSLVSPRLDLAPSQALQPTYNGTFTVAIWDAGFVGSVFRQDGGLAWQPWFRNGEQVMFDVGEQLPASPVPDAGSAYDPPEVSISLPPIDPGMVLGRLVFVVGGPAQQTVMLPPIVDVGEVIELQLTNGGTNFGTFYPPACVRIIAKYPAVDNEADVIGEATVGGIMASNGAGLPWNQGRELGRINSYFLNASDYFSNRTPNSITFDVADTSLLTGQFITVAAVLRGYHEPVK